MAAGFPGRPAGVPFLITSPGCSSPGQRARAPGPAAKFRHHEARAAAARADAVDDLRAALGAAARDDDVRSLGGERLRDRAADVAGSPGHQGRLALQSPSHDLLPCLVVFTLISPAPRSP